MTPIPKVFKVALQGYNAEEQTDPNRFALYVDQEVDYILIKEKEVDTVSVPNGSSVSIAHGLDYVPHCIVFAEFTSGVWRRLLSAPIGGYGLSYVVNDEDLVLANSSGGDKNFTYHIFYDNIT